MNALAYSAYGRASDVLEWKQVAVPAPPRAGEVLVRVAAASINKADSLLPSGSPAVIRLATGLFGPGRNTVLGADYAGVVEAVGDGVRDFSVGDKVFGSKDNLRGAGTFAELVVVPLTSVAPMPKNATFVQAATLGIAAETALQAVDDAKIQKGQRVLVNGAAGGVGSFVIQILRARGAITTCVCSAKNSEQALKLGAARIFDYNTTDWTLPSNTEEKYDAVLDIAGTRHIKEVLRILAPNGTYISLGGDPSNFFGRLGSQLIRTPFVGQKMSLMLLTPRKDKLMALRDLVEAGHVVPAVQAEFKIERWKEAFEIVESGHASGKVVLVMPTK